MFLKIVGAEAFLLRSAKCWQRVCHGLSWFVMVCHVSKFALFTRVKMLNIRTLTNNCHVCHYCHVGFSIKITVMFFTTVTIKGFFVISIYLRIKGLGIFEEVSMGSNLISRASVNKTF